MRSVNDDVTMLDNSCTAREWLTTGTRKWQQMRGFFSRLDNQTVDDAIASWVLNFVFRFQTLFLLTKFMNRNEIARGQRAEWLSITVKLSQFFSRLIDQHCKIIYKWKLYMENNWVHQQGKNVNKNIYISVTNSSESKKWHHSDERENTKLNSLIEIRGIHRV